MGGGIHGAGVARDAALRGLRVLLLEAHDLASGTSSRTSKLLHGGIRYLETGQVGLVREALRERSILLETAPAFVRPLEFLIPHYRSSPRSPARVALGLTLYAALAGRRGGALAGHRRLDSRETLSLEPRLTARGLLGGALFRDAAMDDALLCVAVAVEAARAGADVRTHSPLVGLERRGNAWRARWRDAIEGVEGEDEARWIVNAAGPWADRVRNLAGAVRPASTMRRTRGSHLVLPVESGPRALLLSARHDGRVFFVLPWGRHALVGTTDVDDPTPPDAVAPPPEDLRYLLREASGPLPSMAAARPVRAFAGLRSLAVARTATPWSSTREHRLIRDPGMITLVGGKYTTHRSLAERVVELAARELGARIAPRVTHRSPIGADRSARLAALREVRAGAVALPGELAIEEAEVALAVLEERARRLPDVLLRRTRLWLDGRALREALEPASRWMALHLRWSEARRADEVERMRRALDEEGARIEEAMR